MWRPTESKKWFARGKVGASRSTKFARYMHRVMQINRREDTYAETVTDPESGAIIHECREPLSHHRGHGSARPRGRNVAE
jgi:hypothetical protein